MIEARKNIAILVILFAVGCLVAAGCGAGDGEAEQAAAEVDPHAGHDHGPGEHGEPDGHDHGAEVNQGAAELDWCAAHSVPESECTMCHPELIEDFKAGGDWCAGHGLPESHCRLCNPGIEFPQEVALRAAQIEPAEKEIEVSLYFRPNADVCATDGALIQFASTRTVERSGITVQSVREAALQAAIEAPAEIVFDESRATVVTTTVPALVSRWLIAPGDVVEAGQALAVLQSPEIAELQARYLTAQAAHEVQRRELERHEELRDRELISVADYERVQALAEQSKAELAGARGLLLSCGMSEADAATLLEAGEVSSSFLLRSPAAGLVVERSAQLGELLDAGSAFSVLADPGSMWVEARLSEEQLRHVMVGQTLTFAGDGRGLDRVGAEVIWVSRFLDPHTRTGTVRAVIRDSRHHLQAGEFGRVEIALPGNAEAVLVPKDAVQWEGCCNVVFVKEALDRYRPRKVRFTQGQGPYYQVTEGLRSGEEVVVDGAFLLKTELKKTSLGSGCCGLEPTS